VTLIEDDQTTEILAVVRLGDVDHRGWWQSHGLDETGSFILGRSFKRTWAATAMELSILSARVRHEEALRRRDAVHLFSDELPFFRLAHSWLLERKLDDDLTPFEFHRAASTQDLLDRLPPAPAVERRASGLHVGTISRSDLGDSDRLAQLLSDLIGSYRSVDAQFLAPYFDLT
jgi:hypothetical protein